MDRRQSERIRDQIDNEQTAENLVSKTTRQRHDELMTFCMGNFKQTGFRNNYDEIFDNCFLGDSVAATEKKILSKLKITHVLNAAQGKRFTQIDTNQAYYDKYGIKYYGCELMDFAQAKIDHYIDAAVEFIHQALDVENGRILIHCYMGVSRSATFMLAYMIKYKKMRLEDAIRLASEKRYIAPNDGFLSKLIEYEKNNLVQV